MEDSNNRARKADEERQLAIKQRDDVSIFIIQINELRYDYKYSTNG